MTAMSDEVFDAELRELLGAVGCQSPTAGNVFGDVTTQYGVADLLMGSGVADATATSPALFDVDAFLTPELTGLDVFPDGSAFGTFSGIQESPAASSVFSSPAFDIPMQDFAMGSFDDALLFPDLGVMEPSLDQSFTPLGPTNTHTVPITATAQPASALTFDPTILAAAAAASGLNVEALQKSLQAFAESQSCVKTATTVTPVANPSSEPRTQYPPSGRKRKEYPLDAELLLAELDSKRQKNTEAARKSRQKKQDRLNELEVMVKQLSAERDGLKAELVAEREARASREVDQLREVAELRKRLDAYERRSR
ncbi:uncharacterized protein EV422DRAFT_416968 [Fimicolochytrium jonesii]|uniref:uncharacterized protein n=1 Tax=Fimicolochytrium jonesii TaxID=1396493 RepID=UPI0022FE5904|nr:uncharacterized protein EV422DRAFT_416968 [Fimicolochytrium jonesii]KAI8822100.1 hypothetical protein EV422DRAFT_416968 [Fimicolochytrium jonesii]